MFETWSQRVAAVQEEEGRRALLAEIAVARARSLGDVPATRQATWAMATLHRELGETDKAVAEAQQLVSLCQTPPAAPKGQRAAAVKLLESLGEKAPAFASSPPPRAQAARKERPPRSAKTRTKRSEDPLSDAREAAAEGKTRKVRSFAGDRRGPTWGGFRAWSLLTDARTSGKGLEQAVDQALAELAAGLGIKVPVKDPLADLLGEPLPTKRRAAISALERFADANPDQLDALVTTALEHHVATAGNASAGWLSGLVGRALAHGSEATKSLLAKHSSAPSLRLYDAWAFHRAVRVAAAGVAAGWSFDGLREGVLHRVEPDDRRLWTLRLSRDDGQRLLALAPHASDPWPDGIAGQLGERIAKLSSAAVLVASGAGNAALREAAAAAGVHVLDEDADDAALLEALASRTPSEPAPKPAAEPKAAKSDGPAPPAVLTELLTGEEPPEEARLHEVVATFRRPSSALRVAERANAPLSLAPALLRAVHAAESTDRQMPEGTTLAVRAVAAGVDEARQAFTDEALAARYGGPGAEVLADLAGVLVGDGWEVFRVLRGATRREREAHPMLETLAGGLDGLWRLLVRKGEVKGEVWWVADLPVEGRAAVPQLLLADHHRVVVLPIDPDLLTWYGSIGGPDPIGWSGEEEADALKAAVGAWS
jgi:hypothetical protein